MREVNGALSRRGWGGAGVQCGPCASSLRLRAGRSQRSLGWGPPAPPPIVSCAGRLCSSPRPAVARATPTQQSFLPTPRAPPVQFRSLRRAEVVSPRGRMGRVAAPSSPTPAAGEPPLHPQLPRAAHLSIPAPVVLAWWLSSTRLGRRSQTAGTERAAEAAQAGRARSPAPAPNRAPPVRSGHPCLRGAAGSPRRRGWAAPTAPRVQGGRVGQETLLGERA